MIEPSIKIDNGRTSHSRWRRVYNLFAILLVLAGLAAIALNFALPAIVRSQVRDVIIKAGYPNATFTVSRASLWGARIDDVRAGKNGELSVSSARINYSPLAALAGRIEAVRIESANILVDLNAVDQSKETTGSVHPRGFDPFATTSNAGLPVNRFDLRGCNFTIVRGTARAIVNLDGVLWRETWDGDRARVSIQLRDPAHAWVTVDGSVDYRNRTAQFSTVTRDFELADLVPFLPARSREYVSEAKGKTNLVLNLWYADGKSHTDGSLALHDARIVTPPEIGLTLDGIDLAVALKRFEEFRAIEGQTIDVANVAIAQDPPIEIQGLHIVFGLPQAGIISADQLSLAWAGGVVRATEPVKIDTARRRATATIAIEHVRIEPFLQLVARGELHGEGRVSGELPLTIDWPRVTIGSGHVRADAPGVLHFVEGVKPLAQTIAQREAALRGQENKIVEALANFRYDELAFDFERTDEGMKIASHIAGRGKSGLTTPLDITVHYVGVEELLNAYLAAKSRVRTSGN